MPVNVTIQNRDKDAVPPATLDDFEQTGERREGQKAFALWMLFIFVLVAGLYANPTTRVMGILIFSWWLGCCIWYFYLLPRELIKTLRLEQSAYLISGTHQPRLRETLAKSGRVLGMAAPESYLLPAGEPQIRAYFPPAFLTITQSALELVEPAELDCLILRQIMHFRQKHVARLMMMQALREAPLWQRLLSWPVVLYAFFLRMWWIDLAQMSADRLTLLLVKNHKVISSALLKQYAATDVTMSEYKITSADVDSYMAQNGLISFEGQAISTQYRLGQAIRENPYLDERLHALSNYAESEEFKIALQKLADARAKKNGAPVTAAK